MIEKITLKGEQGKIEIDMHQYERTDAAVRDDDCWITSRITVEVPPFRGEFGIALAIGEIEFFRDQLAPAVNSLSGNVLFENLQSDISLNIEFDKRGGATVKAVVRRPLGPSLTFQLNSDQTYLRETLRDMDRAAKTFRETRSGSG